jgi:WD40 repeat protein
VRTAFDEARDVEAVALSPDGKTLATTTVQHQAVYLYDSATGQETGRIGYPGANPSTQTGALAFSPDGRRLVAATATGYGLHLIDLAKQAVVRTFPHAHVVFAAAFSPDGKYLVAGGYESTDNVYYARLREVEAHGERYRLPLGDGGIRCVAYSPDGATIAVGGDRGKSLAVKLFDAATGTERLAIPFPDGRRVRSVAFAPDGRALAASSTSSTRLFDADTGRERLRIDRKAIGLHFSPDGATLIGAVAATIDRWDAATGRSLVSEGGDSPVARIAATPDGRRVVTLGQDGDGHIWDARTGAYLRRLEMSERRGFALSPDGRLLVWPMADESIRGPDPDHPDVSRTGSRLRMFDLGAGAFVERFGRFEGDAHDLFFADGGKTLVTADRHRRDAGVRLWDVATGRVARSLSTPGPYPVERSRLSPDGKVLAVKYDEPPGVTPTGREAVTLWDLASGRGREGQPPRWFVDEVMAFGPGGATIAVPSDEGFIAFRDIATGRVRGVFHGPRGRVTALAFGADGRLFTASLDATVLAWDRRAVGFPAAGRE